MCYFTNLLAKKFGKASALFRNHARGQATVEAAYLIPLLMLLLLMMTQPVIMLYNRMVMENAATEACRLLATSTSQGAYSPEKYQAYVKRRLAAIPPVDIFHAHVGSDSWDISLTGDESTVEVRVRIVNKLRPLPLLGWGAQLLGLCDSQGFLTQEVVATMPTQLLSLADTSTTNPQEWVYSYD
ncbi:MAG: pilus assembly protein [Coriobacteriales bacterium]|jgi:hypothetical protein|nr:pilus assembly protein [Coriobacteriales bacterium]